MILDISWQAWIIFVVVIIFLIAVLYKGGSRSLIALSMIVVMITAILDILKITELANKASITSLFLLIAGSAAMIVEIFRKNVSTDPSFDEGVEIEGDKHDPKKENFSGTGD